MSEPPSVSGGHAADPKTPLKVITRRRGACRGCKHKKIRCNGGTPCFACDRTGSTCYYEPKSRKASDARELELSAPIPPRPEHGSEHPPSSADSENNPQSLSLGGSSPGMFSLDTNMDFLFSPCEFPFTNPTEDTAIAQPQEGSVVDRIPTRYPLTQPVILEANELEKVRGNAADSVCTILSSWTTLERQDLQSIDHGIPDYCRVDADIDNRFTTAFGLAELPIPSRDSRKHIEICRILRSLTKPRLQTTNSKGHATQGLSSPSNNMHEATIKQCVEACFKSSAELPMFLRQSDVVKRLSEVRESSFPDVLSSLFSDAIIAIGLDVLRDTADERGHPSTGVPEQLRSVLDALVDLQKLPSSLLKLQTTLLFTIISSILDDTRLGEILSIGVQCVRELRYGSSRNIQKMLPYAEDQKLIKRAVWVLYYLETSTSVTRGIPPLLHPDFIDHLPNALEHSEDHDILVPQVTASLLLARALSRVYMQPLSVKTTADLQSCISDLERWRGCLPNQAKQLTTGRGFEALRGDDDIGGKLRLFCCYHECAYLLFGPWLQPLLESTSPPQTSPIRNNDEPLTADAGAKSATDRRLALVETLEKCLKSAYTIVSHANRIVSLDRSLARRMRSLMIISVCIIIFGIQYGDTDTKKESLTYLGICCGTFSSMSLNDSSLPFEEILDLVRIIRSDS